MAGQYKPDSSEEARLCEHCGGPLQAGQRKDARHCNNGCRMAAARERRADRVQRLDAIIAELRALAPDFAAWVTRCATPGHEQSEDARRFAELAAEAVDLLGRSS